jgi:DNA transposition AAA+ family ATPase
VGDEQQPIDRLMDRSRVRGDSRVIADGAAAAAVTTEMGQAVIAALLDYITSAGISRAAVAKSIGIAASTLGQVLNWNYPGSWQQVVIDLDRWLEDQQKRDAAPNASAFVWTKVAQEIRTVAEVASTLKTIGLVYGGESSGVGKTMTLRAIAAEKPGSILVTVEKVRATTVGLLLGIARAMKIREASGGAPAIYQLIKEQLAGTSRLLLIDQIHNLCHAADDRPLFVLSDLFDATGAPQLWCGTTDIVAYLDRGQEKGRETLAQIRRRIGIARDLLERTRGGDGAPGEPLYSIEEIRQVFARNRMRLTPDAARYLLTLANLLNSGALGMCQNLVAMATAINERSADALTADMLRAAHRLLVSRQVFAAVENRVKEPVAARARAG